MATDPVLSNSGLDECVARPLFLPSTHAEERSSPMPFRCGTASHQPQASSAPILASTPPASVAPDDGDDHTDRPDAHRPNVLGVVTSSCLNEAYAEVVARGAVGTRVTAPSPPASPFFSGALTAEAPTPLRPLQRLAAVPTCWICGSLGRDEPLVWDRCVCTEMTSRVHVSCLHRWVLGQGHTHCPICCARYRVRPAMNWKEYMEGCPLPAQPHHERARDDGRSPSRLLSPVLSLTWQGSPQHADPCFGRSHTPAALSPLRLLQLTAPSPGTATTDESDPAHTPAALSLRTLADEPPPPTSSSPPALGRPRHRSPPRAATDRVAPTLVPLSRWVRLILTVYHVTACVFALGRLVAQLAWWVCGDVVCALCALTLSPGELIGATHSFAVAVRAMASSSPSPWRTVPVDVCHALATAVSALFRHDTLRHQWGPLLTITCIVRVWRFLARRSSRHFESLVVPVIVRSLHDDSRRSSGGGGGSQPSSAGSGATPHCPTATATTNGARNAVAVASVAQPLWHAMQDTPSAYRLLLHWLRAVRRDLRDHPAAGGAGGTSDWSWNLSSLVVVFVLHTTYTRGMGGHDAPHWDTLGAYMRGVRVVALRVAGAWHASLLSMACASPAHLAENGVPPRRRQAICGAGLWLALLLGLLGLSGALAAVCRRTRAGKGRVTPPPTVVRCLLLRTDVPAPPHPSLSDLACESTPHNARFASPCSPVSASSAEAAAVLRVVGRRRRRALEHQRRAKYGACRSVVVVRGADYAFVQRELVRGLHLVVCPWLVGVCMQAVTCGVVDWALPLWGGAWVVWRVSPRCVAGAAPSSLLSHAVCVALTPSLDVLTVCGHWVAGVIVLLCVTRLIVGPALGSVVAPRVVQDWLGFVQAHPLDVAGVDACAERHWVRGNVRRERSVRGGASARAWTIDTVRHVLPRELCRVMCRTVVCCVLLGVPSCMLWCGRALFSAAVPTTAQYDTTQPVSLWMLGHGSGSGGGNGGADGLAVHTAALHTAEFDAVVAAVNRRLAGTRAASQVAVPVVAFVVGGIVRLRAALWTTVQLLCAHAVAVMRLCGRQASSGVAPALSSPSLPAPPTTVSFFRRLLHFMRHWWQGQSTTVPPPVHAPPPPLLPPRIHAPASGTVRLASALTTGWRRLRSVPGLSRPRVLACLWDPKGNTPCRAYVTLAWQTVRQSSRRARTVFVLGAALAVLLCALVRVWQRWSWRAMCGQWFRQLAEVALPSHYAAVWPAAITPPIKVRHTHSLPPLLWHKPRPTPLTFRGVDGTQPIPAESAVDTDRCAWWARVVVARRVSQQVSRTEAEVDAARRHAKQARRRRLWHVRTLERQEREGRRLTRTATGGATAEPRRPRATAPRRRTPRWRRHALANAWRRMRLACFLLTCLVCLSLLCFGPAVCVMTLLADTVPHGVLLLTLSIAICATIGNVTVAYVASLLLACFPTFVVMIGFMHYAGFLHGLVRAVTADESGVQGTWEALHSTRRIVGPHPGHATARAQRAEARTRREEAAAACARESLPPAAPTPLQAGASATALNRRAQGESATAGEVHGRD